MKTLSTLALAILSSALAVAGEDLSVPVHFEIGQSGFVSGDNIQIKELHGTSSAIKVGGTYAVDGAYTLASHDEASLCFFTTCISNNGATPISPGQQLHIKKGSGKFHLVETMTDDGYFHVSFYNSHNFGGVYFGQGDRVLREKMTEKGHFQSTLEDMIRRAASPVAGPNSALLEYLGNPVEPPSTMDARYSKEGLISAMLLAAQNAKITVKKVAIDDSEFPYLIGVICAGSDAAKLKKQIKKLDGYEYGGSVGNDSNSDGSDTCNTFNIVPYRAYPPEARQQIDHRLLLRQQVFQAKLSAQE